MTIVAFAIGIVTGFTFGFVLVRSERTYREGWQHGFYHGRAEGYRQAWLKRNKPLLNAETEDWNDDL